MHASRLADKRGFDYAFHVESTDRIKNRSLPLPKIQAQRNRSELITFLRVE